MLYQRRNVVEAIYWSGEQKDVYEVMDWLHQFPFIKRFSWGQVNGLFVITIEQDHCPIKEVTGNTYLVVKRVDKDMKVIDTVQKWKFEEEYEVCN